jgi:hypothetical protein
MNLILVLGANGTGREKIAEWVAEYLDVPCQSIHQLKQQIATKPCEKWEYMDHYILAKDILDQNPEEIRVLHTSIMIHPIQEGEIPIPLIPYSHLTAKTIISSEAPVETVAATLGVSPERAKKILFDERQWIVKLAESSNVPLYVVTNSEEPKETIMEKGIIPFLKSLNDDTEIWIPEPKEGQEIQCSVKESDPETQAEMKAWLVSKGVPEERLTVSWDTWIGIYIHPPMDEPAWTSEEFVQIYHLLKQHPNVIKVDIPEKGRQGQARSTG